MTSQQELKCYLSMSTPLSYKIIKRGRHTYVKVGGCSAEFPRDVIMETSFESFDASFRGVVEDVKNVYDTIIGSVVPDEVEEVIPQAVPGVVEAAPIEKISKKRKPKKAK
jgi:hypothetical protein